MITLETGYRRTPTFDDPLGMLEACHRRIERALGMLEGIAAREREGPLDDRAQTALAQVLHYFRFGVPRHAQDEEESLFPRIDERLPESAREAVARLEREHAALDALHGELDTLGRGLLETARFERVEQRARFGEIARELREIYGEHIRLEDEELFPAACRLLEEAAVREIGAEMASRRGIDWETQRDVAAAFDSRPWARGR